MATFQSFSGVDIHAVFGNTQFGEVQMVSYKSDREKAPVYTMGSADPRTIARGKRLITGAVVFVVFEKDSLLSIMNTEKGVNNPHLSNEETANYDTTGGFIGPDGGSRTLSGEAAVGSLTTPSAARLADQLLPFDITLVGANEYGNTTSMTIQGVELMSESGGISIDDLVIEKQMSFIARSIKNWDKGTLVVRTPGA